jgi:hypothetical protein
LTRPCFAQVDGGFLEYLLAHFVPPAQSGNNHLGNAIAVDGQNSPRGLGFLPRVEPVDQIKPRPRHFDTQVGSAFAERGRYHPKTLIEREPSRPGVPGERLVLLDGGV